MTEPKTRPTDASVHAFLDRIADDERRKDCHTVLGIMQQATKEEPVMWGPSIVGFGRIHYTGANGRGTDWFLTGFSPRKRDLTLYIMSGLARHDALMRKLGRYGIGKACIYIRRLSDIDIDVLAELIRESVRASTSRAHPS